jgi:hypothetical protein
MKHNLWKILFLASILISPLTQAQTQPIDFMSIQILLEKDRPVLLDVHGKKSELTLGNLLSATAESWKNTQASTMSASARVPNSFAMIHFRQEGNQIKSYLYDQAGKNQILNLGNLLVNAALNYPGCSVDTINGKSFAISIQFEKDASGQLQAFYIGRHGKEEFNLATLVEAALSSLNQCRK